MLGSTLVEWLGGDPEAWAWGGGPGGGVHVHVKCLWQLIQVQYIIVGTWGRRFSARMILGVPAKSTQHTLPPGPPGLGAYQPASLAAYLR